MSVCYSNKIESSLLLPLKVILAIAVSWGSLIPTYQLHRFGTQWTSSLLRGSMRLVVVGIEILTSQVQKYKHNFETFAPNFRAGLRPFQTKIPTKGWCRLYDGLGMRRASAEVSAQFLQASSELVDGELVDLLPYIFARNEGCLR